MMLQIGASDLALQKELGAIQNPTLPAFNRAIEGYEQARKTTAPSAHGNVLLARINRRTIVPLTPVEEVKRTVA